MERNTQIGACADTIKKVKEIVDFVYEATIVEGGYRGGWTKYSTRFKSVVTILKKRGILKQEGNARYPIQRWFNPAIAPTKNLYKTIADEIALQGRKYAKRAYYKKKANICKEEKFVKAEPSVIIKEEVQKNLSPAPARGLQDFPSQELWDELKRRGYDIEGGRLVLCVKEYLD